MDPTKPFDVAIELAELSELSYERQARIEELEAELEEARKDGERLTYVISKSNDGGGWLMDHVWDEAPYMEECTDGQLSIRAHIDAARAAEGGKG